MEGASRLSDTAATVLCRPARCPLALLSWENLFRPDKSSLNQNSGTLQCCTLDFWSAQPFPPGFHHLIFPQYTCQAGAGRSICMQRHIMVSVWVLIVVGDVSHTQKDISRAVDKAKRERGWVTILHPGWSTPTCGKTQYLHFAIRTTFFSLYFPEHRLHTSLLCGMLQCDCRSVMACTCLLVTKWKRRGRPLDKLLLWFLFVSARQIALQWHIICVCLWSYLWAYFVPNWK